MMKTEANLVWISGLWSLAVGSLGVHQEFPVGIQVSCSPSLTYHLERRSLIVLEPCYIDLCYWALGVCLPPNAGVTGTCLALYVGLGESNSGHLVAEQTCLLTFYTNFDG